MEYFIKKCGHQELGSVGEDNVPKRGRYLYISKKQEILSFFPVLSQTQINDSSLLPIVPLFSGNKIYSSYTYHNDAHHGGTRDEYRLYLNKSLDPNRQYFKRDDLVVIRKETIEVQDDEGQGSNKQDIYLLDLIRDHDSRQYREVDSLRENSTIKAGSASIYEGNIQYFEDKYSQFIKDTELQVVVDEEVTESIESDSDDNKIASLFNSSTFRDFVMVGYNSRCAITGSVINYKSFVNLEAAHIKPNSHGGPYMPGNGIALGRDIHWAFDKGFFTLTHELKVEVHEKVENEYLNSFDGKEIRIPNDNFFRPKQEFIDYHRENIFGLFETSGSLRQ